jgi:hypothetical protein
MPPRTATRRRNGFTPPYSTPQLSVWVALVASILEFYVFVTPILPMEASIPLTVCFSALVLGVVYYGGKTQLVDPIDVHLASALRSTLEAGQETNAYFQIKSPILGQLYRRNNPALDVVPEDEMKQCWICDTMVADHSMHCKFCNKCIYHFDHHCMCTFVHLLIP